MINDEELKFVIETETQIVQAGLANYDVTGKIDDGDLQREDRNTIRILDGKRPKVCIKTTHVG